MRAFASPLRRVELAEGLAYFRGPQREVVHKCAKFFGARAKANAPGDRLARTRNVLAASHTTELAARFGRGATARRLP